MLPWTPGKKLSAFERRKRECDPARQKVKEGRRVENAGGTPEGLKPSVSNPFV